MFCIVETCYKRGLSSFRFPKDPERCNHWKEILGIQHIKRYENSKKCYEVLRICSAHFEDKCFSTLGKCSLKKDAIPTLNLPRKHFYKRGASNKFSLKTDSISTLNQLHSQFDNETVPREFQDSKASPSRVAKDSQQNAPLPEENEENSPDVKIDLPFMPSISVADFAKEIDPITELQTKWSVSSYKSVHRVKVLNLNKSDENSYQYKCRVCLEQSKKMHPLQGPINKCDVDLYKMINYCVGEQMDLSQDLPQSVCMACFKTIRICYKFIHEYKSNQQSLIAARFATVKLENQNTDYHQEHVDALDLFTATRPSVGKLENNHEENLKFSSYTHEENRSTNNKTTNYKDEELNIKFEHDDLQNYNYDEQVQEITIDGNSEETILLNFIKQDIIDAEEEETNNSLQFPFQENIEEKVIMDTVNFIKPQSDNLDGSDNLNVSIVQSKWGSDVHEALACNSTVQSDHNYVSVLNSTDNPASSDNCSSVVPPVVAKSVPILPKVSQVQNILITPLVQSNSPVISSNPLKIVPVNTNITLLPVNSNLTNSNDKKIPQTSSSSVKTIILKKHCGPARTNLNPAKKRIIILRKRKKLEDDSQQQDKTDDLSQQLSNKTSRRVILSYPCPKCPDVVFKGHESNYKSHILSVHGNEPLDCNKCSVKDLTAIEFLEHFLSSHRFECPECQKTFKNKHGLVTHLRKHLNIRHFCTYPNCTKSFAMPFALKKHLEEHTGQVKYPCKICGHISTTYDTHSYHVRMHGGRKFLCTQCGQTFLQASHLKAHMWKHTGKKSFKCDECNNSYTSLGPLKKHKRKYHQ